MGVAVLGVIPLYVAWATVAVMIPLYYVGHSGCHNIMHVPRDLV